ncbi:MAG: 50S ribosomal protein L9 [Alphaproteobacteria bacterium]
MEVILLERIEKLGQMGDVVNVKPGYARNYLLPQRKALRATKDNRERFERERTQLEATNLEHSTEAESVAAKLEDRTYVLLRQASEAAQLYGSVSARDIAETVTKAGVGIERTQVQLERPIKTLGIHVLRVRLHPEVIVSINVNVARSAEEAEAQAAAVAAGEPTPAEITAVAEAAKAEAAAAAEGESAVPPAEQGEPADATAGEGEAAEKSQG